MFKNWLVLFFPLKKPGKPGVIFLRKRNNEKITGKG